MKFISNKMLNHKKGEETMKNKVIEIKKKEQKSDEIFIASEQEPTYYILRS